tara:strand:+ start:684 stop:1016 length:333 start_codon:yes stop_codon:yes gene_type:complete
MSKFVSTFNKGFNMVFENGISISVQWGVGNYCDRKDGCDYGESMKGEFWEATSAEIMIRDTNDDSNDIILGNGDVVAGWLSTDTVAKLIHKCSTARNVAHLNQMLKRLSL